MGDRTQTEARGPSTATGANAEPPRSEDLEAWEVVVVGLLDQKRMSSEVGVGTTALARMLRAAW